LDRTNPDPEAVLDREQGRKTWQAEIEARNRSEAATDD
jgi:hypothetical protein